MSAPDEHANVERLTGGTVPDHLLAEAAASVQSDIDADVLAEAAEILTAERVALRLADRLGTTVDPVIVTLRSGCRVEGAVERAGGDVVVLVDRHGSQHCIALASAVTVRGLRPALSPIESGARAADGRGARIVDVTWGMFLRDEPGIDVRLVLVDGTELTGLPALVGADHVDILGADGQVTTCALVSISRAVRQGRLPDRR